ncbi:molybdenum cofactor guanylyltransferase [Sphingomonas sp. CJ20]
MRTLGVVLAGGESRRFGSDKAVALLAGRTLIDHALAALAPHVDALAVAGRTYAGGVTGVASIPDYPAAGLGPLGGLAGALRHARAQGFARVLSCSVDAVRFPAAMLTRAPCYLAAQPVIGLWPADAAEALAHFVEHDPRRSMRGFAAAIGAVAISVDTPPENINAPEDLARVARDS